MDNGSFFFFILLIALGPLLLVLAVAGLGVITGVIFLLNRGVALVFKGIVSARRNGDGNA